MYGYYYESSSDEEEEECWECDTCTWTFGSYPAVAAHMDATGHWEHYCHECERHFENRNNLQQHLNSRIHRGTNISCPFCSRSFTSASGVSHHLERGSCPSAPSVNREVIYRSISRRDTGHSITRPMIEYNVAYEATQQAWNGHGYECYICHREFNSLHGLNQHVGSVHNSQNLYHCPNRMCGREFTALAGLMNHLESESYGYTRFETVNRNVGAFFDGRRAIGFR